MSTTQSGVTLPEEIIRRSKGAFAITAAAWFIFSSILDSKRRKEDRNGTLVNAVIAFAFGEVGMVVHFFWSNLMDLKKELLSRQPTGRRG